MVRTLASNTRAIGGKTPKKAAATATSSSSAGGGSSTPKSKAGSSKSSGGVSWRSIPITKQEVPAWQKPITNFFQPKIIKEDNDDDEVNVGASSSTAMHEEIITPNEENPTTDIVEVENDLNCANESKVDVIAAA